MSPTIHRARPIATLLLAIIALAACKSYDPRTEPDGDPDATPTAAATVAATSPNLTPAPTAAAVAAGPIHAALTVATANAVTIDVTDESATLVAAISGTPGDGASVEAYKLVVTNLTPTSLRLTWLGGPCDSANSLSIDAPRGRLLLVQPECPGDAMATDRILDLTFSTPIKAGDFETFLQDGLDT
jgi:hypothetical protein